jgi:hypothetical protein
MSSFVTALLICITPSCRSSSSPQEVKAGQAAVRFDQAICLVTHVPNPAGSVAGAGLELQEDAFQLGEPAEVGELLRDTGVSHNPMVTESALVDDVE